ncbi:MAG: hypothetical protein M9927_00775 [Anaerolineae bacterium]|nr:hypothetical protein [Anaerolineae bacterium]
MKVGGMTNPQRDVLDEIRQVAADGFDFVDLTLEAPKAEPQQINAAAVRRALEDHGLGIVCHAAPYLPVNNPSCCPASLHWMSFCAASTWLPNWAPGC